MSLFDKTFDVMRRALARGDAPQPSELSAADGEWPDVAPALPAERSGASRATGPAIRAPEDFDEFGDFLSGLGAEAVESDSTLERKDREILELQSNLEMLRPIGDQLAVVEQQRLAERREWQAEVAKQRERLAEQTGELRKVMKLVHRLEHILGQPSPTEAGGGEPEPAAESRLQQRLEKARTRAGEYEQKAVRHWQEVRRLRARARQTQTELVRLRKQLRLAATPVRRMLRRTDEPSADLTRLAEVLGLGGDGSTRDTRDGATGRP
jgi:hypothetical protein